MLRYSKCNKRAAHNVMMSSYLMFMMLGTLLVGHQLYISCSCNIAGKGQIILRLPIVTVANCGMSECYWTRNMSLYCLRHRQCMPLRSESKDISNLCFHLRTFSSYFV